ncbi:restriction endonuclease subunit S [Mesorhizobium sp. CA7]|uniref:restriction endonuclease subunit S n=1 Tax=Mesorhizobium sp. CA7 TaxID=588501 RepID=UPI001CCBFF59|nr:restriction endonuclease subunit S [Mesorhizobium sp. CA7]MBZ9816521.1 restriction endonuclease subunit S [Mesorhizobium sp. CA7]
MTLPAGWTETTLGDLGNWQGGGTPSKLNRAFWTNGTVPWVSPKDMKRTLIDSAEDYITEAAISGSATNLVQEGSVLLVTRSGILQHSLPVAINIVPVAINQDLKALTPKAGILSPFVGYTLQARGPQILREFGKAGTTVDSIEFERLKSSAFALPPTSEQRLIVQKLDTLTAHLARVRTELDRIAVLADQLRSAALSTARAQLVASVVSITDLAISTFDGPFGSNLKSADYVPSGIRVIRLENIGRLKFIADKRSFISTQKYEALTKHTLKPGDILFSSFVDRHVRVCQFPAEFDGPAINKADCFTIRPNTAVCDARFVTYMLASPQTYDAMKAKVHGATRPRIGLSQLRGYELPLPDLEVQARIADQLDVVFADADRLEAEAARARALLNRLEAAVLAKGCCGELIPQDPDDEPASVLLERIMRQQGEERDKSRRLRKNNSAKEQPMTSKSSSARDKLLEDSQNWPTEGLKYEEVATRIALPHDELRDALFELLSEHEPKVRQVFDKASKQMMLQRIAA